MNSKPPEDEIQELRNEFQEQKRDDFEQDQETPKNKFVEKPLLDGDAAAMIGGIIEAFGDVIINILGG